MEQFTELMVLEISESDKAVLKRMARVAGLETAEQMATNLILMAIKDFRRTRR